MSVPTSASVTPFDLTRTFTLDQAGKDQPIDRAKLVTMAQEFEGMLLLQMVRQMRQSMLMDEEADTGLGNQTMTDTFDVEFARYLAKQGGIGLSKAIEQQIEKSDKGKEDIKALRGIEAEPKSLVAPDPKAYELNATPSFPVTRPAAAVPGAAKAGGAAAGEATAAHARVEGHASALPNHLPPSWERGGRGERDKQTSRYP